MLSEPAPAATRDSQRPRTRPRLMPLAVAAALILAGVALATPDQPAPHGTAGVHGHLSWLQHQRSVSATPLVSSCR